MAVPVRLHLLLSRTYFQPGDTVSATIQIANDADPGSNVDTYIRDLSFQASGSERIDPSWIVKLYRPDAPAEKDSSRKVVRNIFMTDPATLAKGVTLLPRTAQQYDIRFRLPAILPPTFKGSSIKFSYTVDVKAVYEVHAAGAQPVLYETTATTSLLVYPPLPTHPSRHHHQPNASARNSMIASQQQRSNSGFLNCSLPSSPSHSSPQHLLSPSQLMQPPAAVLGSGPSTLLGSLPPTPSSLGGGELPSTSAPAAVAAVTALEESETPMIVYRLHIMGCKVRWQEVMPEEEALQNVRLSGVAGAHPVASGPPSAGQLTPGRRTSMDGLGREATSLALSSRNGPAGASSDANGHPPPLHPSPIGNSHAHHSHHNSTTSVQDLERDLFKRMVFTLDSEEGTRGGDEQEPPDEWDVVRIGRRRSEAVAALNRQKQQQSQQLRGGGGNGGGPQGGWVSPLRGATTSNGGGVGGRSSGAAGPRAAGGGGNNGGATMGGNSGIFLPFYRAPQFGRSYVLNAGEGQPVIKILLQTPLQGPLQLGSTFGGVLDFRGRGAGGVSAVCCHQVVVMLEAEEVVSADCRPTRSRASGSAAQPGGAGGGVSIRKLYCEHQEITTDTVLSHFQFTVPATATPSFRTPMVTLRWLLRFEMSVGARQPFGSSPSARAPELQQLVWALPLVVQSPIAVAF